ncbi:penicillin-binding protein 2 [Candidatus Pelagibacter sp.]|uniref:penicillin-binding protein 2 n=1 Tax=Candidatus Pelagibacter sp. TaxID=2024849 RepID=UPI003F855993
MFNISDNVTKVNLINRRLFIVTAAKILVFLGLSTRLYSLQVKDKNKYLTLSDKNRIRESKLPPVRGEFLDYFGKTVAGNNEVYQLHLIPEQVENFRYVSLRLKNILNMSDKQFQRLLKKKNEVKPWDTIVVSDNLTWEQFSRVNSYLYELTGVKSVLSITRIYPHKEDFTHVLGYVSQANENDVSENEDIKNKFVPGLRVGKTGLEKAFEKELLGENDIQRFEVNAYGKKINQIELQKGSKGKNIRLTIDTEIQKYCSDLLKDRAGSICVMDIYTGEIIAMQSAPSFDPNLFLFGINQDDWQLIRNNPLKPLVNKTISGKYSPGSTIKPIVALSALENKIVSPQFTVKCEGKTEMYGQTYHCWKKKGHGFVSLKNAMKQSCDTYFYEIARRLGVDRLSETAKKFGLGERVFENLFFNEKKGLVPNTQWKKNALGSGWLLGETMITGIGQGYIQTTPIQLCLMTAQIANGGYKIYPKITVDTETNFLDKYEPLFKEKKNIKIIQDSIFSSTNEVMGTSYSSRINDPKYRFAGKTGTAQVKRITAEERELDLKTSEIPYEQRDHALYVAYGPTENPRYALSIIIEHGGSGGTTAAPMAKKLFKLIIDRHKLREEAKDNKFLDI